MTGATEAAAQSADVVVELRSGKTPPDVAVSLTDLLDDDSFVRAMRSGFPLYLEYVVQLKRRRSNWFDDTVADFVWEYVILYDPVRESFAVEDPDGREEFNNRTDLARWVQTVYVVEGEPVEPGRYYYEAIVTARTLSDEDIDEAFDWLRGEDDTTSVDRPGFLTRSARRLLVRVAPLPRVTVSAKSPTFRVP